MKNNKYTLITFSKKAISLLLSSLVLAISGCSNIDTHIMKSEICHSVSKRYSLVKSSDGIKLQSYIKNYSNEVIQFGPDEFNSALYMSAVLVENNKKIQVITPMAGVPMPVTLNPLQTYKDELLLNTIIPNLNVILKDHSVKISWSHYFEPDESCFSSKNSYSIIIEKEKLKM